jgi:hypothetical protein
MQAAIAALTPRVRRDDGCMTRAKARRRVERLISVPVRTQGDFLMTTAPDHIVVVNLENESFDDVVGNVAAAPFLNKLISQGMLFSSCDSLAHPSQPNYLALFSGSMQGATTDTVSSFPANVPTLAIGRFRSRGTSCRSRMSSPPRSQRLSRCLCRVLRDSFGLSRWRKTT